MELIQMFQSRRDNRYYENDDRGSSFRRRRPRGRGGNGGQSRDRDEFQDNVRDSERRDSERRDNDTRDTDSRGSARDDRQRGESRPFRGGRGFSFQKHSAKVINKINSKIDTAAEQKGKPDDINGIMFFSSKRATNKFGEPLDYYLMPFVGYVKVVSDELATELKKLAEVEAISNDVVFGRDELNDYEQRRNEW